MGAKARGVSGMSQRKRRNTQLTKNELKNIIARLERDNEGLRKQVKETEIKLDKCNRELLLLLVADVRFAISIHQALGNGI